MTTAVEKRKAATKPLTHWLAHYQPGTVIAVDEDGEEHPITITRSKQKWNIAAKAIESVDAVTVRCLDKDGGILATRKLRTVEVVQSEEEGASTPATPGGFDVTAVVSIVAKEFRETTAVMREMVADVVRAQAQMLKDMGERHSASEKALQDAREQIMLEREERLTEREEIAAKAEADAADKIEREDKAQEQALVMKVLDLAGPKIMEVVGKSMNGAAPAKTISSALPAPPAPVKKPDA